MTPQSFVAKWSQLPAEVKEIANAQPHFIDLCHVLGQPTPADVDKEDAGKPPSEARRPVEVASRWRCCNLST